MKQLLCTFDNPRFISISFKNAQLTTVYLKIINQRGRVGKTGRNGKVAARGRKTPKALAFKPKRSKAPFMTHILLCSFTTLK